MAKILLVEDDKSLREIYGVRLLAEGYDIVSAGDGEEALAMAIKDRPELILSDVMMPKISGFDMLDILRSTTETRDVKVIMMTALSSDDQRERGEKLGADRYLVKSQVGIEDVVRTVHEVLGDAPTTTAPSFNSTRPNAASSQSPVAEAAPEQSAEQPAEAPVAAPQPPEQATDQPSEAPQPQPAPQPVEPAPKPELPQPTAPFSSDRPANFGNRVVSPPERSESTGEDQMSNRIEQELAQALASVPGNDVEPQPQAAEPAAPRPEAVPAPQPAPEQVAPAAAPQPEPVAPQPQAEQTWQPPQAPAEAPTPTADQQQPAPAEQPQAQPEAPSNN